MIRRCFYGVLLRSHDNRTAMGQTQSDRNPDRADLLGRAVAHHQSGRLEQAAQLYQALLSVSPADFEALHLLGILQYQRGNHADALKLVGLALKIDARSFQAYCSSGTILSALGRHEDALEAYNRAILLNPKYPEAFNNRGNAFRALKRPREALASFEQAIAARPQYPEALNNLGNALMELGQPEAALASYDRALAARPSYHDALFNRASARRLLGRLEEALVDIDAALELNPNAAASHTARGDVLLALKRKEEALQSYERALELEPRAADALAQRGRVLRELGQFSESIASYDRALMIKPGQPAILVARGNTKFAMGFHAAALNDYDDALAQKPNFAEAHGNRGNALRELGRHQQALEAFDRSLALKPDYEEGYNNRGNALNELNRPEEALADYDIALGLNPNNAYAWVNRGTSLRYLGRFQEALASFDRAIELHPALAEAHWNSSLLCLSIGDFARGWEGYEWRWRRGGAMQPRDFPQPQWRGEDVAGRTILLHAEQGFGDSIQFLRYVPMVAARGAKILLELPQSLIPLVPKCDAIIGLYCRGDRLPSFETHCPLMSLPLAFETRVESIPTVVPYLQTQDERLVFWQKRLADIPRPRIGLTWSGKTTHKNDHNRSIPLQMLEPILSIRGVHFISLQREYRESDALTLARLPILRLEDEIRDFSDTAAILSEIDLIISVDTAVAHLAGALARPLWLLIPHIQDWRWLTQRCDSPWYPTARLFRQPRTGGWPKVIAQVRQEIERHFRQGDQMTEKVNFPPDCDSIPEL
ncbi:MAG TPA: tetratricopeptide repeat protein [Pseudolabrys sp.]|nr:tetratricopeptide repeat protein [Pseudolabrys sp.]